MKNSKNGKIERKLHENEGFEGVERKKRTKIRRFWALLPNFRQKFPFLDPPPRNFQSHMCPLGPRTLISYPIIDHQSLHHHVRLEFQKTYRFLDTFEQKPNFSPQNGSVKGFLCL